MSGEIGARSSSLEDSGTGASQSALAGPGRTVEIRLNPECDASPGFDLVTPANNVVTLVKRKVDPDGA